MQDDNEWSKRLETNRNLSREPHVFWRYLILFDAPLSHSIPGWPTFHHCAMGTRKLAADQPLFTWSRNARPISRFCTSALAVLHIHQKEFRTFAAWISGAINGFSPFSSITCPFQSVGSTVDYFKMLLWSIRSLKFARSFHVSTNFETKHKILKKLWKHCNILFTHFVYKRKICGKLAWETEFPASLCPCLQKYFYSFKRIVCTKQARLIQTMLENGN